MIRILCIVLALTFIAGPAAADPVSTAIAGFVGKVLGGSKLALALGSFAGRWVVGQAFSLVGGLLNKQRSQDPQQGIQTTVTLVGGTNSQSFPLGRCATGGQLIYPRLGHSVGGLPNEYRVHVILLSSLPGATLEGLFVDGAPVELGTSLHADYGAPVLGDFEGRLWIKYYDGSQTAADPMMMAKYGSHPDYPWAADMVGDGLCYAILTAKYDPDFWGNSQMQFRFEMLGIPVYDARKDSTAGGSGAHRLDDPSTWEQTENLALLSETVMRGITMPTGEIWGGRSANLPLAIWAAAKNECDVAIPLAAGGTEPQFKGGLEVKVDQEPHQVVDAFLAGCFGQMADVGGAWHIHVGAAPLPVYFFTDDDLVVTEELTRDPFQGIEEVINGVTARHPDPDAGWEFTDAPPHYNPTLEAEDRDERRLKDLTLAAVPYSLQVQRLQKSYVDDSRRFERFRATLPPDALAVNVLDTIAWTSERYGYSGKLFGVTSTDKSLKSLFNAATFRERDPSDGGDWTPSDEQPTFSPSPGRTSPDPLVLPGFGVGPIVRSGDSGSGARPGIEIIYTQISVSSIFWRVRVKATEALVGEGVVPNSGTGRATLPFDALPATTYQVQALVNLTGQAAWTSWLDVTTYDIRIGQEMIDPAVFDAIEQDNADQLNRFHTRSLAPYIQSQEDFAEQAMLDMAHAFSEELADKDRLAVATQTLNTRIDDETGVLAESIAALLASTDAGLASANAQISALVTENGAQASDLLALYATTGGHTSAFAAQAIVNAGLGGSIQHTLDVNGHIAGWALSSDVLAGGAVYSAFVFAADMFQISGTGANPMTPFTVYTAPRDINGFTVPPGVYIESMLTTDNLQVTGELSAVFATIGHFKSAQTGGRMEIKDNQQLCYDDAGNLRVKFGYLG
ncbi:MAG: phage tail protein [Cognatishimia activa]